MRESNLRVTLTQTPKPPTCLPCKCVDLDAQGGAKNSTAAYISNRQSYEEDSLQTDTVGECPGNIITRRLFIYLRSEQNKHATKYTCVSTSTFIMVQRQREDLCCSFWYILLNHIHKFTFLI